MRGGDEIFLPSWGAFPYVFSLAHERSTSHVVSQYFLGRGRHSCYPLAPGLARRTYRRRSDPYPAGDSGDCLSVQPPCGTSRGVDQVSYSSRHRAWWFVRQQEREQTTQGS